jgi:hypothetical protein
VRNFSTYEEAVTWARAQARELGCTFGLEDMHSSYCTGEKHPAKLGGRFHVFMLPRPENRQGHELRCEVIDP